MAILNGSRTHQNLKTAFANEAQAYRRYLYFARLADLDGYPDVAGLFRDTAEGEAGHAQGHLDLLREVGDPATGMPIGGPRSTLAAAIAGETEEATESYPRMAAAAREEGFPKIADWFERIAKAEQNHAVRFRRGLDSVADTEKALQQR